MCSDYRSHQLLQPEIIEELTRRPLGGETDTSLKGLLSVSAFHGRNGFLRAPVMLPLFIRPVKNSVNVWNDFSSRCSCPNKFAVEVNTFTKIIYEECPRTHV